MRSVAALVYGQNTLEALTARQLADLALLVECAVRGRVTKRSLDSWLAQFAEHERPAQGCRGAAGALVEKVNEVELAGTRDAA